MRKLAWAARGMSVVSGAVLLGALMVPSAVADDTPGSTASPNSSMTMQGKKCGSRDVSSAAPDFINLPPGLIFRVATDAQGHSFLNDSRNPGVWINLGLLANAPTCVTDSALSVTEATTGVLYITLLNQDGVLHEARCTTSTTPFTPVNLVAACGTGFSILPNTPVV
ncbi:hypothetical protein Snoj_08460 [Streptomyces nojiriensis]|uniref:Secreted protein n=1 Tax=Streptomyces nojiriensis TaxID=66374 RepID=A0ABQ3SFN0_9ACTN|nr:hypothetical protein [Streptomyces nojiriensis]QTI48570.1 hypothetical protein JYK04_06434 [Streptomyces nojiriensis]GGS03737.1 hypothetical protein GCM10010205_35810 [Streptomyces nojiriensis]GHI66928.1 hypothetical protein Snoj_08460 [Streptomyces nojiriensis]